MVPWIEAMAIESVPGARTVAGESYSHKSDAHTCLLSSKHHVSPFCTSFPLLFTTSV